MSETSAADRMTEAIRLLESLAEDARGQGIGSREYSASVLVEMVRLSEEAGRLIDGIRAEVAHEVDARTSRRAPEDPNDSLAHAYGFGSSYALLQQLTLTSRVTITKRLRVAEQCRTQMSLLGEELPGEFEHVGEAFFSGRISIDTAEVITRALGKLPSTVPPELIDVAERNLVSHATGVELGEGVWDDSEGNVHAGAPGLPVHTADIEQLARGWVAALDQDGTLPREETLSRRFMRLGRERHGLVPVHGSLLPEVAAMLERMCDAILNPRVSQPDDDTAGAADAAGVTDTGGDAAHERVSRVRFVPVDDVSDLPPRDTRTADQKRHDALATIFGVAMKHEDMPRHNGEALTLTIQVTEKDLMKRGATAWIPSNGGLTPVDSGAARHAGCAGSILRVTQNDAGRIVDIETTARVFNAHQRRAIMLRDGGCIMPGCTQSATWCEVHHVTEWRHGGTTHTDNGVLLCWFHHRHLETHGWDVRIVEGVPEIMAPPWLDPEQQWRQARSVHKPPEIMTSRAGSVISARSTVRPIGPGQVLEACEVRDTGCIPQPKAHRRPQRIDYSWPTTRIEYLATNR